MKEQSTTKLKLIGRISVIILIIIILTQLFIFSFAQVVGNSMTPTIKDGQWIITNHLTFALGEPERGDVVTIEHNGQKYIKRIIGLPNETLELIDQQLYIDGIPYTQVFITNTTSFWTHDIPRTHIPSQHYYVLGDNRIVSKDSRNELGFVSEKDITGRAEFIIYPFRAWGIIY